MQTLTISPAPAAAEIDRLEDEAGELDRQVYQELRNAGRGEWLAVMARIEEWERDRDEIMDQVERLRAAKVEE